MSLYVVLMTNMSLAFSLGSPLPCMPNTHLSADAFLIGSSFQEEETKAVMKKGDHPVSLGNKRSSDSKMALDFRTLACTQ